MAESNYRDALPSGGSTVTPANTNLARPFTRLWVAVTGNIEVKTLDGTNLTFNNVPVGWFNMPCTQVRTGTTATVVGVY